MFSLITQLIANADDTVKTKLTPDAYQISIPTMTDTFIKGVRDNMLKDGNAYGIRKRDVYNYLYYKLIERYSTFLPQDTTTAKAVSLMEIVHRHMKKQKKRNPLQLQVGNAKAASFKSLRELCFSRFLHPLDSWTTTMWYSRKRTTMRWLSPVL